MTSETGLLKYESQDHQDDGVPFQSFFFFRRHSALLDPFQRAWITWLKCASEWMQALGWWWREKMRHCVFTHCRCTEFVIQDEKFLLPGIICLDASWHERKDKGSKSEREMRVCSPERNKSEDEWRITWIFDAAASADGMRRESLHKSQQEVGWSKGLDVVHFCLMNAKRIKELVCALYERQDRIQRLEPEK